MSIYLVQLGKMVLLVNPNAVGFLVWVGDCPWGHLISMRVWHRGTIYLAVMNRAASSASVAEDMKILLFGKL